MHQARVTIEKLSELYKVMYSFIDEGDQNIVDKKVKLPVLHNFNIYNEEYVTVATLQSLYRCLYKVDTQPSKGSTAPLKPSASSGPTVPPGGLVTQQTILTQASKPSGRAITKQTPSPAVGSTSAPLSVTAPAPATAMTAPQTTPGTSQAVGARPKTSSHSG